MTDQPIGEFGSNLDEIMGDLLGTGEVESFKAHLAEMSKGLVEQIESMRSAAVTDAQKLELTSGPLGFPKLEGVKEGVGLLEWLESHGVWGAKAQATAYLKQAEQSTKVPKHAAKRVVKDWESKVNGAPNDPATMLTHMLMHPELRQDLFGDVPLKRLWQEGFVPQLIRFGHRWTGQEDPQTLDAFIAQHAEWTPPEGEHPEYWPMELWPVECDEDFRPLERALTNYLYKTALLARRWDSMTQRERNGVLLSAYGVSAMLCTTLPLMPFAAMGGEVAERLNVTRMSFDGLSDDKGRPSALLSHTLTLAKLVYGDRAPGDLALQLISPVSRQLDNLLLNADQVRSSLRSYRTLYLKKAHKTVKQYLDSAMERAAGLPDGCRSEVERAAEHVGRWAQLTGLSPRWAETMHPSVIDYWQKHYTRVADSVKGAPSFTDWLNDHMSTATGESLESLQAEMAEATARMDTDRMTEIVQLIGSQKAQMAGAVTSYVEPLIIPQALVDRAPEPAQAAPEVSADELAALRSRLAELESEAANHAELLELHDHDETQLRQEIEALRAQLHAESSRNEALAHQLAAKPQEDGGVSQAVVRAMGESPTLKDALDAVRALYPNRVEILPSAYASIEGCGYKNVRKLIDHLIRLCGDYYEALVIEGEPDSTARHLIGSTYRAQESDTTLMSTKLRSQREFVYNGETLLFEQHLTLGIKRGDQSCLQVFFKVIEGAIVIAYVGPHLDTATT